MNTASFPRRMARLLRWCGAAVGIGLLCCACESLPKTAQVDFPPATTAAPATVAVAVARPANGSLFQAATYRPSFEDRRARAVGDIVTILIVENISASQKSSSTANRTSGMKAGVTAFPFLSDADINHLGIGTSSANDFSGKGGTESANTFTGSITTTVTEVLPNGHLVVVGEKQIGVNQNVDVLRFSGTVDPRLVQPGGIVNSTQVANARIESKGRGAQGEAQTVGWLTRFFFSFLPF